MIDGHAGLTFGFEVLDSAGKLAGAMLLKLAPVGVTRRGNTDVYRQAPLLRGSMPPDFPSPTFPSPRPTKTCWARRLSSWRSCRAGSSSPGSRTRRSRASRQRCARCGCRRHGCWPASTRSTGVRPWPIGRRRARCVKSSTAGRRYCVTPRIPSWGVEGPDLHRAGETLHTLLTQGFPDERPIGVVHGDFQPGNILYQDGKAMGLIDWELASIGAQGSLASAGC